jgi:hypothetical protein
MIPFLPYLPATPPSPLLTFLDFTILYSLILLWVLVALPQRTANRILDLALRGKRLGRG